MIYYWNSNNLGDLINIYIGLKNNYYLFKPTDVEQQNNNNGIFIVGSVLKHVGKNNIVFGVGFKHATDTNKLIFDNNTVKYVRGDLTKNNMNDSTKSHNIMIFEPGLIVNNYYDFSNIGVNNKQYLIIPHYNHSKFFSKQNHDLLSNIDLTSISFSNVEYKIITDFKNIVKNKNEIIKLFEKKFKLINNYDVIMSSSLHALVFAIAFNKKFVYFSIDKERNEPDFKYNDFFSFFNIKIKKFIIKNDMSNLNIKSIQQYINYIDISKYEKKINIFNNNLKKILL